MLSKSVNYSTIWADARHYAETKIVVGGTTYGQDQILSCAREQSLYSDSYSVGESVMNQIKFTLLGVTAAQIPMMSRVEVWTRLWDGNGSDSTDWLPMGVYYTAKPEYDTESTILTVTGYDEMFKANVVPFNIGTVVTAWDSPSLRQVAQHIASGTTDADIDTNFPGIGVALEDPTQVPNDIIFPAIPYNYLARNILNDIALAAGGNWTVVFQDSGSGQVAKLRLLVSSPDSFALGRDAETFEKGDTVDAVTNVKVYYGYNESGAAVYAQAKATPDDGRAVEATFNSITDGTVAAAAASNILAALGDTHIPFSASNAGLDPACELGDVITVNGITSVIGAISTQFHQGMWADVSAPGIPQDEEFGYTPPAKRNEIQNAINKATIKVNTDAITAEVQRATSAESDMNESLRSTITQTADEVKIELQDYAQDQVNNHAVEQQQYIRYSASGLELGESGTNAKAILTNEALKFYNPSDDVKAYIGLDELYNPDSNPMEQGAMSGGTDTSSNIRVRTNGYIAVSPSTQYVIKSNIPSVGVKEFSSSQSYIQESAWENTPYTFTTSATTYFIRLVLRYTDNSNIVPADVTELSITATNGDYKFFVINGHIVRQLELGDHWLLVASGSDNDNRLTFKWRA